jgi:peptidoglycan/xylan/chitin deacetylase (PgdA/CDA1 family)
MSNTLNILLYHGVTDVPSKGIENVSRKHIPVAEFAQQMEYIRDNCTVLSMDEVVDIHHLGKKYPKDAVAVTFDDGFKNNATVAAPVLTSLGVPATFYFTAGIINTDIMFWVDEIEDCVNSCELPSIEIELSEIMTFPLGSYEEKVAALTQIKGWCKLATATEKNRVIAALIAVTGVTPSVNHADNYLKMNWKELRDMSANPLFIIGGHSLYHDILSSFSTEERLAQDLELSIKLLEYHMGRKMTHYAYPEGQAHHYNETVIRLLKEMGIVCSPSAIHGANRDGEFDLFNLRRVMVGFNGIAFPWQLS